MTLLAAWIIYVHIVGMALSLIIVGYFEDAADRKGLPNKPTWFLFLVIFGWPFSWLCLFIFQVVLGPIWKKIFG